MTRDAAEQPVILAELGTDDAGRSLTRLLAELSVNKAEGVPTRRYVP